MQEDEQGSDVALEPVGKAHPRHGIVPAGKTRRAVGRPRRLTLAAIIDAACDIGLANLDMPALARRLNTGVATLYTYVRGRDHLLQLVAEHLAEGAKLEDRGQSWQTLLRDHAAYSSAVFAALPHLIGHLIGAAPSEDGQAYSRLFLRMLVRRGFPPGQALSIYTEVNQIIIGAAICAQRSRVLDGVMLGPDGVPVPLPAVMGHHGTTLERLIRDLEHESPPSPPSS